MTTAASCDATLPSVRVRATGVGVREEGVGMGTLEKGERSRARRTSTPARGASATPSVSAGRRRPKVAAADGQERTRGGGRSGRTDGRTDEEEHERENGMAGERARQGRRGSAARKAVRQCRTLFPWNRTESRAEHRENPSVIGPRPEAAGGRKRN